MLALTIVFRFTVVLCVTGNAAAYMATIELPDDAKDEIEQCQQRANEELVADMQWQGQLACLHTYFGKLPANNLTDDEWSIFRDAEKNRFGFAPPPSGHRIRREIRTLSDDEWKAVADVFVTMYKRGIIRQFGRLHGEAFMGSHKGAAFLGWHRVFLLHFEEEMRKINPSVALPYWDYTIDNNITKPTNSVVWTSCFFGNNHDIVTTGPFRNFRVDGSWTEWYSWSLCDVTCGNGIQTRTRSCANPVPDFNGQNCSGISIENKQCSNQLCSIDGGWTQWTSWDFCTALCGFGMQRRHRNCTNPKPQYLGEYCLGDTLDVQQCQISPCPAFRSKDVKETGLDTVRTFVFTSTTLNIGHGYDNTTGIFTAPVAGTYSFSTHLCLSHAINIIYYAIVQNNVPIERGQFRSDNMHNCHTIDALAVLMVNDTVCVKNEQADSRYSLYQDIGLWNTFSGVYIR